MPSPDDILKILHDSVVTFEEEKTHAAAQQWIEAGYEPLRGIMDGLVAGMNEVGQLFKRQEYFVPEVLLCAEAMNAGLEVLKPHVKGESMGNAGTIVLGTIQGDIHDLGKNLVRLMLEVDGFTVHDIGVNVEHERFVETLEQTNAQLVGISAMMTTTMMGMKQLIPKLRDSRPNVGILIGGAPVTPAVAKMFQADGFAVTAVEVAAEARRVLAVKAGV